MILLFCKLAPDRLDNGGVEKCVSSEVAVHAKLSNKRHVRLSYIAHLTRVIN